MHAGVVRAASAQVPGGCSYLVGSLTGKGCLQLGWVRSGAAPLTNTHLPAQVDIIFNGHVHAYERTKPMAEYKVRSPK